MILASAVATISGGEFNNIGTNSGGSAIGGGAENGIAANSEYATIPGGFFNTATNYAFAAGTQAKANHTGAFVWGDSTVADVTSSTNNEFTARASGGVRFFSNTNLTAGVSLAPGGGSWTSISNRHAKENFADIDTREVLEKVAALPVRLWNYKSQAASVRHIGPTAQDFKAAFGVGETDTGIPGVDADGVALAAIQGLNEKVEVRREKAEGRLVKLEERLQRRDAENTELKARLATLDAELAELNRLLVKHAKQQIAP